MASERRLAARVPECGSLRREYFRQEEGGERGPGRARAMVTFETLREMVLALPGTEETTSWDAPVFKVPLVERDFLIEADPATFFTTDHHRPHALVLARPDRLDPAWARSNIERVWRAQARKATVRAHEAARGGG